MKNVMDVVKQEINDLKTTIECVEDFKYDFKIVTPVGEIDVTESENILAICHIALGYKQRRLENLREIAMRDSRISE